jgi:hypothetical protein
MEQSSSNPADDHHPGDHQHGRGEDPPGRRILEEDEALARRLQEEWQQEDDASSNENPITHHQDESYMISDEIYAARLQNEELGTQFRPLAILGGNHPPTTKKQPHHGQLEPTATTDTMPIPSIRVARKLRNEEVARLAEDSTKKKSAAYQVFNVVTTTTPEQDSHEEDHQEQHETTHSNNLPILEAQVVAREQDLVTPARRTQRIRWLVSCLALLLAVLVAVLLALVLKNNEEQTKQVRWHEITVMIQLDDKPEETGWSLDCGSGDGNVISVSPGSYAGRDNEIVIYADTILYVDHCEFTILDAGGDGIDGGYYKIYRGRTTTNSVIIQGSGVFADSASVTFRMDPTVPMQQSSEPPSTTLSSPRPIPPTVDLAISPTASPSSWLLEEELYQGPPGQPSMPPSTKQPTPLPTDPPISPRPTSQPTQPPTRRPTSSPTRRPTPQPTQCNPCYWSSWGDWGECSDICDGIQYRTRNCECPAFDCGNGCSGSSEDSRDCNESDGGLLKFKIHDSIGTVNLWLYATSLRGDVRVDADDFTNWKHCNDALVDQSSGYCLERFCCGDNNSEEDVELRYCDENEESQKWELRRVGGFYQIRNREDGCCLDVFAGDSSNGGRQKDVDCIPCDSSNEDQLFEMY